MPRPVILLSCALAASVAGNVLLVATRGVDEAPAAPPSPSPSPPSVAAPRPAPPSAPVRSRAPVASATLPAACPDQLAAVEARLADAEREVEARLRLDERFDRSAPSAAADARVRPLIERALADAPDSVAWDLECRGEVCRLEVVQPDGQRDWDWSTRLQEVPGRHDLFVSSMFSGGAPTQDPVSKAPLFTSTAHFQLRGEGMVSGLEVLGALLAAYHASPEVAACKTQHPAPGWLSLRLRLDPAEPHITIDAGGSLAVEPGGACLLAALEARAAATSIPPGAMGATQYETVRVP